MEYIKVKDHPDLVREAASNAILNIDNRALNKYKEEREEKRRLMNVMKENENLRSEVDEIKQMLKALTEKNK
jgi:hypothetical protein